MAKILRGIEHIRIYHDYGKVQTTCDVNTETKEVFNIKSIDADIDENFVLAREYIVINGKQYDCFTAYRCK